MRESPWLREIRTLDPEHDCRRIVVLDSFHEFPFDTTRALELALFKTFASPTIAALLDSTGEFRLRGQKRYDDHRSFDEHLLRRRLGPANRASARCGG
jgi:hypothetical protein